MHARHGDRAGAAAGRDPASRNELSQREQHRLDQRVRGLHVAAHRGRPARIEQAALAHDDLRHAHQAVVGRRRRAHHAGEAERTRRLHQRRAQVRRPARLVGRSAEVEADGLAPLGDANVHAHRIAHVDAVVVHERLAFELAVGPEGDLLAQLRGGDRAGLLRGFEHRVGAVALHGRLDAALADAAGAELSAQIAADDLRGAAVGADDRLDVAHDLAAHGVAHRGKMQPFVEDFPRLARTASGHRAADVGLVRDGAAECDEALRTRTPGRRRRSPARAGCRRRKDG